MQKIAQGLVAVCFCAGVMPAIAQPFTCGDKFLGSDVQAQIAQAIVEEGCRAVGVQRVFTFCQKGVIQIVLDGNNEQATPRYKKRWHQRAITLLEVPPEKLVVR